MYIAFEFILFILFYFVIPPKYDHLTDDAGYDMEEN